MAKPRLLLMNGRIIQYEDARVHVLSTAMKYAASVYEAMRAYWSDTEQQLYIFRLRDHLRRLQRSAKIARVPLPADLERLERDTVEVIRANGLREDLHVRLIVFVDTDDGGLASREPVSYVVAPIPTGRYFGARPRLVSVQVPGGAVVKAFHEGLDECLGAKHVETIAPGIMVVNPFADFLILRALRATGGWVVGVPDAETLHFMGWANRHEGLFLSPEGAATIAAVRRMVREGKLGPTSRVVVFNTATGLRYPHLMGGPVPVVPGAGAIDDGAVARAAAAATGAE